MNICYWNIHKNDEKQSDEFNDCLIDLLNERSIDLFCISEFEKFDDSILLNNSYELVDKANCDKVMCYKRIGLKLTQIRIDDRYVFVEDKNNKILFVCLHAYDSIHYDEYKRLLTMEEIKMDIDDYIEKNGETAVFIFGDFNCMPYSMSIVNYDVLNCVLFRDLLKTRKKTKERYYNPMLLLLSEKDKVYGSYFKDRTNNNLRWYLLDQIIVNKNSDSIIKYDTIELICKVRNRSLMKNNKPNSGLYSDHLPLYFEICED